jgi:hypothetical protein
MVLADRPRFRRTPAGTSAGFVLPMVLWIIAALGVVAAAIATWVQTAVSNAQVLRDRTAAMTAIADIRNELVFLIATRPMSVAGLEIGTDLELPSPSDVDTIMAGAYTSNRALVFDGRAYRSETHPNIEVSIQDGRGLLNLNDLNPARTDAFLRIFGLPEPMRNRLLDTLRDYIDEDDLTRISGAESREYIRAGRLAPANQALITPYQAQEIFGWSDVPALWAADEASPLVTTCQSTGFNPNTAPETVLLAALPRLSIENAKALIEQRRARALRNQRETAAAAGISLFEEPFFYSFAAGPCTIFEFTDTVTETRTRLSLTMLPFSKTQPWRHDYELRIPRAAGPQSALAVAAEIIPSPESTVAREGPLSTARSLR